MVTDTQVPGGWGELRLENVASLRKKQVKPAADDSRPYVALEHIMSGGSLKGYGKAGDSVSNKTTFHRGDTLYGKLRPNLRKVVRANFDGVCSTDILAVFAHDLADGSFLSHLIRSDLLHRHAMRGVAGTKMPRTSWSHLKVFNFGLPPLSEQRAIAAVLDSIDEAIERTEAVIAATEHLRESLLHELLSRGVPGWHSAWKEVRGIGTIPADWDVARLGDVIPRFDYGTSTRCHSEPSGIPVLRIPNIARGELHLADLKYADLTASESASLQLSTGDVLLVRTNGNPEICGRSWVTEGLEGQWAFASYLVRGRPDRSQVDPAFVGHHLSSAVGRRLLRRHIRTSAGNYNLSVGDIRALPIPLPRKTEQETIVRMIASVDSAREATRLELQGGQAAKNAIADALLTGRVRVSV